MAQQTKSANYLANAPANLCANPQGYGLAPMSETELSAAICKALEALGYPVIRIHSGTIRAKSFDDKAGRDYWMRLAKKGTPDRLVMLSGGRVLWLEVKLKAGKLSPDQVAWHRRATRDGHKVVTVRSVSEAVAIVRLADKSPNWWLRGIAGTMAKDPERDAALRGQRTGNRV